MRKVEDRYALDDVESIVWNNARNTLLSLLATNFCDSSFKAMGRQKFKQPAACCRVRVLSREFGFCTFVHVLKKNGQLTDPDIGTVQENKQLFDQSATKELYSELMNSLEQHSRFLFFDTIDCGTNPLDFCSNFVSYYFCSVPNPLTLSD